MDSKEGIEMKPQPDDARAGAHLAPSEHQRTGPDDAGANLATGADPLGAGSPAGSSVPPDGFNKRESYCLFVRVLKDCKELLERDRLIPPHSWNEGICLEICQARSGVPPGTLAVELLSDSEFLLLKLPRTGRGMTYDDSGLFQDCIEGSYYWGGTRAVVDVARRTRPQARRDRTKTRDYRRRATAEELASAEARLKQIDLAARKREERKKNPPPRGRGMTRRADEEFAKQYIRTKGKAPGVDPPLKLPQFASRSASPLDDFHSAMEPSDSSEEEEESSTDDDGGSTTCSEQPSQPSGGETDRTDRTRRTDTSNRAKRRDRKKRKEDLGKHPTNAKKEENRKDGKVVLSLFRDSPKEGALTYIDWRREVEEYLRKGFDNDRIKSAMLSSVEGQAYVNFMSCDEGRSRTPAQILQEMDGIYNVSITFRDLNARMCGMKQGPHEPIKAYYERMADVSVKLEQYHGDRFGPGELSLMKKDCFYAGLKESNKYLVSHMKDQPHYGPAQMLKEIREQEDSRYPPNTTPKPLGHDHQHKNADRKNVIPEKARVYAVRKTDLELPDPIPEEEEQPGEYDSELEESYDEGYYVAMVHAADEIDRTWGRCYNCAEEGHQWRDCTKPLKESLRLAKERLDRKKKLDLNRDGGTGAKGGRFPQGAGAKGQPPKGPMAKAKN